MNRQTIYDFELTALDGETLKLRQFEGRPILLVNTASRCAFTAQYEGLQALWSAYRDRGLVVIGAPSNDFGNQEPGDAEAIRSFCSVNYGVSFPMTEKLVVRGRAAHPLFRWLGEQGGVLSRPRWNFYKYLIDGEGRLRTWFSSIASPMGGRVRTAVDRVLLGDKIA